VGEGSAIVGHIIFSFLTLPVDNFFLLFYNGIWRR
jgi:hypothetical protein